MKNAQKRVICFLFAVCMAVTSLMVPDMQASAATVDKKKVRITTENAWSDAIRVTLGKGEYKIAKLKPSSSNLIVRTTNVSSSDSYNGSAEIRMYAKKEGTYKVTFDIVNRSNKKVSSHSVTVYAYNDSAFKQVALDGDLYAFYRLTTKKSGKFQVTMNPGYKLSSIEVVTYDSSGKEVRKKIKNGNKATFGQYRSKTVYSTDPQDTREDWSASLLAYTYFYVTYQDKYTKEPRTTSYYLYRVPKN